MLNPYYYPFYPFFKFKKRKRRNLFPKPIEIHPPSREEKKKKNTKSTESEKFMPFVAPLENYLVMINRFRKNSEQDSKN